MEDIQPPQSSSLTLPSPPSEMEAKFYYAGLPSAPVLVARSSTTPWKIPTSVEEYHENAKDVRHGVIQGHSAVKEVWDTGLRLKIIAALESMKVKLTTLDIVRIGKTEEYRPPIILWIGVTPASLSGSDGVVVALKCRELLVESNVTDVDVEIRESVAPRHWPSHMDPTYPESHDVPAAFALPSCTQSTQWAEGSGSLFIADGWNTETLLVPARHVVFIPDMNKNKIFERKNDSKRRYHVRLFADAAFNKGLEGKALKGAVKRRQRAEEELAKEKKEVQELRIFHENVSTHKTTPESRLLSAVTYPSPITVDYWSGHVYTEDWAAIDLDTSKVDLSNLNDNAVDLVTDNIPANE
ncbi:hypothetical protein FA95DRAFT_1610323 [Auriscalpium vulgare]|uniref:Uncharacterized protein n=1 Tax=Auriscalpium vulgare TaxID=40419 RepID=A0ACB8REZ9_9AGAM|nr:hypothetical protein FA95DRAFT_1610323 [Auriscalpium vulgare]